MKKLPRFLMICMIFAASPAFSQHPGVLLPYIVSNHPLHTSNFFTSLPAKQVPAVPFSFMMVHPAFYVQHWGKMCAWEWKLEQRIKLPVKLRLGSVTECNRLEGKR